jgi:hypothetical protein
MGLPAVHATPVAVWVVEPYLHVDADSCYNPLTGRRLAADSVLGQALGQAYAGTIAPARLAPEQHQALVREGWLVESTTAFDRRARLRVVSLETRTACNQKCYFCPVAYDPRPDASMPDALFTDIVEQLAAHRATLEGVFLMSYNEPTLDVRFVEQCQTLLAAGLPAAVNTNATGLTPARSDALVAAGGLRLLSVNLSTLDARRYAEERGADHLALVLRNLDHVRDRPVAREMLIAVLGRGDDEHRRQFEAIRARFAGSRFEVRSHEVMDRAGRLPLGLRPTQGPRRLAGCDNLGSRPLEHLHITPRGECVLCCEDYDERYVVGDLRQERIAQVLAGDALARLRRFAYGLDDAPADFICRRCVFARTR